MSSFFFVPLSLNATCSQTGAAQSGVHLGYDMEGVIYLVLSTLVLLVFIPPCVATSMDSSFLIAENPLPPSIYDSSTVGHTPNSQLPLFVFDVGFSFLDLLLNAVLSLTAFNASYIEQILVLTNDDMSQRCATMPLCQRGRGGGRHVTYLGTICSHMSSISPSCLCHFALLFSFPNHRVAHFLI